MRAGGIGVVVASKTPVFKVGDHVTGGPGLQEYWHVAADPLKRSGMAKIDLGVGSGTQWLNVLGMPGMTGYFGLLDVGLPKAGETVVVGIAGGPAKCEWVVKELGFDAVLTRINKKARIIICGAISWYYNAEAVAAPRVSLAFTFSLAQRDRARQRGSVGMSRTG